MNVEEILREFAIDTKKKPEIFEVICPFHQDNNPSGNINQRTGFFNCWVCSKRTTLVSYLVRYSNLPIWQVKAKIGYKSDCKNPISPMDIENSHQAIWQHPTFLHELHHRCISDEIIRKRRLGVNENGIEKRISIPIQNDVGEYAGMRLYLPGAKERKFLNAAGKDRSKIRLTPIEQLEFDQILVCGGELKAYAAAEVLNQFDIGAIAPTCGENVWPNEFTERFAGKLVYVNCDIDRTGERYAEQRCRILRIVARAVHKVILTPESVGYLEKGDLNDFLRLGGNLYELLINTPEWQLIPGGELIDEPVSDLSFKEAFSHENVGKRTKFVGIIAGVNHKSYFAPEVVEVKCNRNEEFCTFCDVNSQALVSPRDSSVESGMCGTDMKIAKENSCLLGLIGERTDEHYRTYKNVFRIPANCRQCTFNAKKNYSLTEVVLDEQVDPTCRDEPATMKTAFVVNNQAIDQQTYSFTGRLYPNPKNQEASFLISQIEPTQDALDSYQPPDVGYLDIFQPKEWSVEAVEEKLDDIYTDFELNITRIYQRRDYHLAIDLFYHSMLSFHINDTLVNAYTEILVIGDTEQGKSEAITRIREHYGLGFKVDCKNITLPGLTIGLDTSGKLKRFAIYGAMPRNDKKAIILEELKGMHPKIFQALTEVRSSGKVQITKIDHKIRQARVRLFAISNCIDKREISSYTYGIEAAIGVIGTNEDLRRFDLVMIMAKNDIDGKALNETLQTKPTTPHKYTADLCQKLVLKAWKCEKVIFEDFNHILETTRRLVEQFGDGTPVLGKNGSHIKVAKLSAALAARTCSYEDDTLIIRKCHVEVVERFLVRNYSSASCRLNDKSKSTRDSSLLRDKEKLIAYLKSIPHAPDVMLKLGESDEITSDYVKELCGDFYTGSGLFSRLIQSNAIQKIVGKRYAKTPEFTKMLQNVKFELEKPEYIRKEENF